MSVYDIYVGVDPGQSGGLVAIRGNRVRATHMPSTEFDICDWFNTVATSGDYSVMAMIEKVHSMPGQGVASTFKFGRGYGGLRMALIANGIAFDEVTPQKWQKGLGVVPRKKTETPTQFKNRQKAMAQQLFPNTKVTLATADALLIAWYCKRLYEGRL